jgi:hypothetical protein
MNWVPVSEKLPKPWVDVLIYYRCEAITGAQGIYLARIVIDDGIHYWHNGCDFTCQVDSSSSCGGVTHWMPLV